jgi:hypothetical protein
MIPGLSNDSQELLVELFILQPLFVGECVAEDELSLS